MIKSEIRISYCSQGVSRKYETISNDKNSNDRNISVYKLKCISSITCRKCSGTQIFWIPAFAGMTANKIPRPRVVIPAKAGIQESMPRLIEILR